MIFAVCQQKYKSPVIAPFDGSERKGNLTECCLVEDLWLQVMASAAAASSSFRTEGDQRVKRRKRRESFSSVAGRTEHRSSTTKVRNAPLAIETEGAWCCAPCPSPRHLKNLDRKPKPKPKAQETLPPLHFEQPAESDRMTQNSATECKISLDFNHSNRSPLRITAFPSIHGNGDEQQQQGIFHKFNHAESSDVKLSITAKQGFSVNLNLHMPILVNHSRYFASKISQQQQQRTLPYLLEIVDCDDVEIYVETLRLMYCNDLKRRLINESVSRVLRILKVSAAIVFDAGILSCLEYLEAVPWPEEEEEKVTSLLMQLQLDGMRVGEVLKRISTEDTSRSQEIVAHLLQLVLKGSDEKARREMKVLVSKMLRENASQSSDSFDVSSASLYHACNGCLDSLLHHFMQVTSANFMERSSEDKGLIVSQIARQADNLHWLLDILTDRQIADDFVGMWANQAELAALHSKIPIMFRFEVSRLTARLCIAIGKGQVLSPKDVRFLLLQTWLQPLIDDYGWIQRACKSLDRKVVEEGISQTILTLPLKNQQSILLAWFNQFLSNADDCPNLQRAFEVWWRRTFLRPYVEEKQNQIHLAPDILM